MDVGVRELKQNLSAYLDRAEKGEMVVVTDRGRPKAIIVAPRSTGRLEEGIDAGWIRPARAHGTTQPRQHRSERRILDVLAEDRGE